MKEIYELHIAGTVKPSESFSELQSLAKSGSDPYEIYLVKQSAMNKGLKGRNLHRKILTDAAIEKALALIDRGRTQKDIAKQMHIGPDTLSKAIREYKLEKSIHQ